MYKIYELVNFNLPDNFDDFNNDTEIRQSFWALTPRSTPALGSDHELFEKFVNLCKKNGVNERVKNIYVKRGFLLEDDESQYDYDKYRLERKVANDVAEILPQKFPDISDNVYIGGGANGYAYKTNDFKVLKVTSDPSETYAAKQLLGQKPKHLTWIYKVLKILDNDTKQEFFAILEEYIPEKPKELFTQYFDTFTAIAFPLGQFDLYRFIKKYLYGSKFKGINESVAHLEYFHTIAKYLNNKDLSEDETEYIKSIDKELLQKFQKYNSSVNLLNIYAFAVDLVYIRFDLEQYGLGTYIDFGNVDNLGYKNGVLKYFDIAKTRGFAVEPPEFDKEHTVEINEENEIENVDRLKYVIEVIFKKDFSDFFNKLSNGDLSEFNDIKDSLYKYFKKNPKDKNLFYKYIKSLKNINERKESYMNGSKIVTVKKNCRLAGKGNTSDACNQGDINNLEFGNIKEDESGYGIADKIYAKKGIIPQDPDKHYNLKNDNNSNIIYKGDIRDFLRFTFHGDNPYFYIYKNPQNLNGFETGTRGFVLENGDFYICSTDQLIHVQIFGILKKIVPALKNVEYKNTFKTEPHDYMSVIKSYKGNNTLLIGDVDRQTLYYFKERVLPYYENIINNFESKNPNIKINIDEVLKSYHYLNEGTWEKYYQNNPKLQVLTKGDIENERDYQNYQLIQKDTDKNHDVIIYNDNLGDIENIIVIKNPTTLENIGRNSRGVILDNGDSYFFNTDQLTHDALLNILYKKKIITNPEYTNYYIIIPSKLGFLTVQKYGDTSKICVGESNIFCNEWNISDLDSDLFKKRIYKLNNLPLSTSSEVYVNLFKKSALTFLLIFKEKNSNIGIVRKCWGDDKNFSILEEGGLMGVADKMLAKNKPHQFSDKNDEFEKEYQQNLAISQNKDEMLEYTDKYGNANYLVKNPESLSYFDPDARGVILENGDTYILMKKSRDLHLNILDFLYENGIINNDNYSRYLSLLPRYLHYLTIQRAGNKNLMMIGEGSLCGEYSMHEIESDENVRNSIFIINKLKPNSTLEDLKILCKEDNENFISKAQSKNPNIRFSTENILNYDQYNGILRGFKKNYMPEGVGDEYLKNKYNIPTDNDLLDKKINLDQKDVIGKVHGVEIIKNPGDLNGIGRYVRGVVDLKGNLYVESEPTTIHYDLLQFLRDKHVINSNVTDDMLITFEAFNPSILGGVTVIRYADTNNIYLGGSNMNVDYMDERDVESMNYYFKKVGLNYHFNSEDDIVKYFEDFYKEVQQMFSIARKNNPKINFIVQSINTAIELDENNNLNEGVEYDLKDLPFKDEVEKRGGKIYSVGGIVRDEFLGKESKDLDLLITGIPFDELGEILKKYGKVNEVGKQFGIIKFIPEGATEDIDIAIPRTEKATGEGGHKGFEVTSDHTLPIEDDLKRRDFTINAIAKDINGKYVDPFNGIEDLKNKTIRVVNSKAFGDDPLRMLRAVQFAARFGFTIEPKTMKLIQKNVNKISQIPGDRIITEFQKIVQKGNPYIGAKLLQETGLYEKIFDNRLNEKNLNPGEFNKVKLISEFIYLLTKNNHKPIEFYKNNLRLDNKSIADIKAFWVMDNMYRPNEESGYYRVISHNMYLISPRTLESQIPPNEIIYSSRELLSGKYPKTVKDLNVNGSEISQLLPDKRYTGKVLKNILILIYYDRLYNIHNDLVKYVKVKYGNTSSLNEAKKSKYQKTKDSLMRSKNIPKEMKEKILKYLGGGSTYHEGGRIHGLKIPKVKGKRFHGVSLGADKNGFYVYTHRAASKRYDLPDKIPQKSIDFIESTG